MLLHQMCGSSQDHANYSSDGSVIDLVPGRQSRQIVAACS